MRRNTYTIAMLVVALLLVMGLAVRAQIDTSRGNVHMDVTDYRATMIRMVGATEEVRTYGQSDPAVFLNVAASGDELYIAPLLDVAFYARVAGLNETSASIFAALQALTGEDLASDWSSYFTWASENDIELPPDYAEFKGLLFSTMVDPEFARFWRPGVEETAQINLLEAVWGGVRVDGIPSLVNATQISPEDAAIEGEALTQFCREGDCSYPNDSEYVFGVSINGDSRAYPLRLLNWHEMFNDVIGHTPLLDVPGGEAVCNFRAPTPFAAVARHGDDLIQINGQSAGCPESGWVAVDAVVWEDGTWEDVRDLLPDVSEDDTDALDIADAVTGSVDGMPVMLSYCTLCGAGILYDVTIPDLVVDGESMGETVLEFGSTGMLMRSNKLMYDRNTDTVWNALTGEPAFGPLAGSDIQLDILPVVVSDWATWYGQHPDTSVLGLETGYSRDYTNGGAYGEYFNNPDFIMFPVWQQDVRQTENKDMVFALNLNDTPKAYPIELLVPAGVVNDSVGGVDVVIVAEESATRDFFEPGGASVRAYASGGLSFEPGETAQEVVDVDGGVWQVTEAALVSEDGETLERLGGHLAFWFGWFAFYPETEVFEETSTNS